MASPAIAIGPTPLPMKMLSIMLYKDVATLAMIAGTEYCVSNFPIARCPKSSVDELAVTAILFTFSVL